MIILADDMGYSDIQPFGGEISTPNIEKLAQGGREFTQFYNTARCCPSRASLLTGLYSHEAGIGHLIFKTPYIGYGDHLTSDCVTIAEVLHDAGYNTYMVGKWHVAPRSYDPVKDIQYWPTHRGFEKFYGTINGSDNYYDPATLCRGEKFVSPYNDPEYKTDHFYYTDALTDNGIKFLQDHETQSKDKPFFMYVAYTAAHWPMQAPPDAIAPYDGKYDAGYAPIHDARIQRLKKLNLVPELGEAAPAVGDWAAVPNKKVESDLMETYAGMVTRMDQGIGKILDQLRTSGELDNTLIIFLQDNGGCAEDGFSKPRKYKKHEFKPMAPDEIQTRSGPPMQTRDGKPVRTGTNVDPGPADTYRAYKENWANVSNAPFRKYKHYVHEGGISTPLIAYWPDKVHPTSATQIVRDPAHLIDLMPTLVQIGKAKYPAERQGVKVQPMEGVSLASSILKGSPVHRSTPIFWEHEGNRAVRDGKWKLVALGDQPWELYDMSKDRGEMHDLAKSQPAIVAKMAQQWQTWAARARVLPLGGWKARNAAPEPASAITSITLTQGQTCDRDHSLAIMDRGVSITAQVLSGPVQGVIVAQGASLNGFSLYAQNGKIAFITRTGGTLHKLENTAPLPPAPFTVHAVLTGEGKASLTVGNALTTGEFYDPLLLTPDQGIAAGLDTETPVGEYPKEFPFQGKLAPLTAETILPKK